MDLESTPLHKVTTQKKTKTAPSALYGCQPVVYTCVRGRPGDDEGWEQHRTNTGKDMAVWELQGGQGAEKWGWENHKQRTLSPKVIMLSHTLYTDF